MKAVIAGAGIAGLTTALALFRAGYKVDILERAPALNEVGAGIQLSPNAMKVLRALGLEPALMAAAFEPSHLEMRFGRSGRRVFSIPAAEAARKRWGAPYLNIHRSDLQTILLDALSLCDGVTLVLGQVVTGYETGTDGVSVYLDDGEKRHGDVLVGADGLHSAVRQQMMGPDAPTYTGNMAWRATVPLDQIDGSPPPPTACVWVGKGRHAVTYRIKGGDLVNFVGVVECAQDGVETWTQTGDTVSALADFDGWVPTITKLIGRADTLYRWPLFDRPPLSRWHEDRVILLGDAAHPTLPFLAQGAAMAIEDAYVLAQTSKEDGLLCAIAGLHHRRGKRTSQIHRESRANMKRFHPTHPVQRLLTYGPMWMAGHVWPSLIRSRQDWIYGANFGA